MWAVVLMFGGCCIFAPKCLEIVSAHCIVITLISSRYLASILKGYKFYLSDIFIIRKIKKIDKSTISFVIFV